MSNDAICASFLNLSQSSYQTPDEFSHNHVFTDLLPHDISGISDLCYSSIDIASNSDRRPSGAVVREAGFYTKGSGFESRVMHRCPYCPISAPPEAAGYCAQN